MGQFVKLGKNTLYAHDTFARMHNIVYKEYTRRKREVSSQESEEDERLKVWSEDDEGCYEAAEGW